MSRTASIVMALMLATGLGTSWAQPKPVYLWAEVPTMQRERTRLYVYDNIPDSLRTGLAMIVCPGGSYHHLGMKHEGHNVAQWLNRHGIAAYVLRYRVGAHGYHHPAMLEDVQLAMRYVRNNPKNSKLGLIGFSAGGHLVAMAGAMHRHNALSPHGLSTAPRALRPDFVVPVYPVVSMRPPVAHARSRKNLIGRKQTQTMIDSLSLELHVPADMPPTLLIATADDPVVNPRNAQMLDSALTAKGIEHKFVFFETGGHGFGHKPNNTKAPSWEPILLQWLSDQALLPPTRR